MKMASTMRRANEKLESLEGLRRETECHDQRLSISHGFADTSGGQGRMWFRSSRCGIAFNCEP
jgi:hypothetical protein